MTIAPKISVIIPIYNAEAHLGESLDSASRQTFGDIEIICVDDCSIDATPEILRSWAREDGRVRVIRHAKNMGEGGARNSGLDAARGEYVFHLDADDTLPLNALELMLQEADLNHSDLVKGCMALVDAAGKVLGMNWPVVESKIVNTNIHEDPLLRRIPGSHCSYLYRRGLLNEHKIRYRTDLKVGLDLVALAEVLVHAKSVTLIPDVVYYYRQTEDSATRGSVSERVAIDAITTKKMIAQILRAAGLPEEGDNRLRNWRYDIRNYWTRMTRDHGAPGIRNVLSEFRSAVSGLGVPWEQNTPFEHRYLLSMVLAKEDDRAIEFLSSSAVLEGFKDDGELKGILESVLAVIPTDSGSLLKLGSIASRDGELDRAHDLLNRAIEASPNDYSAKIEYVALLRKLSRFAEAHAILAPALEQSLGRCGDDGRLVQRLITQSDHLNTKEKKQLQSRLDALKLESEQLKERFESKLSASATETETLRSQLDDARTKYLMMLQDLYAAHFDLIARNKEVDTSRAECAIMRTEIAQVKRAESAVRMEMKLLSQQLEESMRAREDLHSKLNVASGELSKVRRKLEIIYSSFSWKVTAPSRKIIRVFKNLISR